METETKPETSTRAGNFSSSSIWKLMTRAKNGVDWGKPALTYIAEKQMELRLGRELSTEVSARPTSWGNLVEKRVFDLLPMEYVMTSKVRYEHPTIKRWNGMPDTLRPLTVSDIKCPITLKSFCELVDSFSNNEHADNITAFKEHAPDYYWQGVSNCVLTGRKRFEIIVYVPYKRELAEIRESAGMFDGDQNKVAWVNWAQDDDLPYLIEGRHYKNLNQFEFEVPEKDIIELTSSVERAVKLLLP